MSFANEQENQIILLSKFEKLENKTYYFSYRRIELSTDWNFVLVPKTCL